MGLHSHTVDTRINTARINTNYGTMKPVPDGNYPYWPPGSPQHSEELLRTVQRALIKMLPQNQIPFGNGIMVNLRQLIKPISQPATGPGMDQNTEVGHYGSTLYDQFMNPYSKG